MKLALLMFVMCSSSLLSEDNHSRPYIPMVHKIQSEVRKKLSKRHHMFCVGIGGGLMTNVECISIVFQVERPLSQDEARAIVVDSVEELCAALNNKEELRPYLDHWPMGCEAAQIRLVVLDEQGRKMLAPELFSVFVANGNIVYVRLFSEDLRQRETVREPYSEALKMVRAG